MGRGPSDDQTTIWRSQPLFPLVFAHTPRHIFLHWECERLRNRARNIAPDYRAGARRWHLIWSVWRHLSSQRCCRPDIRLPPPCGCSIIARFCNDVILAWLRTAGLQLFLFMITPTIFKKIGLWHLILKTLPMAPHCTVVLLQHKGDWKLKEKLHTHLRIVDAGSSKYWALRT